MPTYTATRRYRSGLGQFDPGDQVELTEDIAEHINRDSPGVLAIVCAEPEPDDDPEKDDELNEGDDPENRQLDAPPTDRMVKGAQRRRER